MKLFLSPPFFFYHCLPHSDALEKFFFVCFLKRQIVKAEMNRKFRPSALFYLAHKRKIRVWILLLFSMKRLSYSCFLQRLERSFRSLLEPPIDLPIKAHLQGLDVHLRGKCRPDSDWQHRLISLSQLIIPVAMVTPQESQFRELQCGDFWRTGSESNK